MGETRLTKTGKTAIDKIEPFKLWLIPEIYGWLVVALGFAFFVMLLVAAVAHLMDVGLSFDSLFSLVQLGEGITIGGGFIAFGAALRRFLILQGTLCVIFLLVTLWFLYFFSIYSLWEYCIYSLLIGTGVIFPLALCIFVNRKRFNE